MSVSRAARRKMARLQPGVDRVVAADAAFFARRPDRTFRARLASSAELRQAAAMLDADDTPAPGARWVVLIRQLAPGVRFRAYGQALDVDDLDGLSDADVRTAYEAVVRPGSPQHAIEARTLAAMRTAGLVP